jgi:hypothetical protein
MRNDLWQVLTTVGRVNKLLMEYFKKLDEQFVFFTFRRINFMLRPLDLYRVSNCQRLSGDGQI